MIIAGVILIVAGVISVIYGVTQNNSVEAQLEAFFGSGTTDPGTVWIIVGAIAVVLGAILLVIGLMKRKGITEFTPAKTCVNCGAKLAFDAVFCPHCGTSVKRDVPPVKLDPVCPTCGAKLPEEAVFCTRCGTALTEPKTDPAPSLTPVPKPVPGAVPVKDKGDRKAICPHCGARQSTENVKCKYCGTPMG